MIMGESLEPWTELSKGTQICLVLYSAMLGRKGAIVVDNFFLSGKSSSLEEGGPLAIFHSHPWVLLEKHFSPFAKALGGSSQDL